MAKVLIVDDEVEILQEVAECLEFEGFDILMANDGPNALQQLRNEPEIAVVVSDQKMPGMDGAEMLAMARDEGLLEGVGTILVSGHLIDSSVAIDAFTDVVRKPLEINELVEAIRRHLG